MWATASESDLWRVSFSLKPWFKQSDYSHVMAKQIVWLGLAALLAFLLTVRVLAGNPKRLACTGAQLWKESADTESTVCLSCHDGVVASDRAPRQIAIGGMGQTVDHPVMMSYVEAYVRNRSELVPAARVDRRVKLINGKIECVTCHVSASGERSFLVMRNGRDELCVSCHVK